MYNIDEDETIKIEYLHCECNSLSHVLRVILYEDTESSPRFPTFYINMQLNNRYNIFKRMWIAIKYIFNPCPNDFHWVETVLDEKQAKKLADLLDRYMEISKNEI